MPSASYELRGDGPNAPRLGFHRRPNRPDEAEEFTPDGRHDLLFAFPPRRQGAIARVQPVALLHESELARTDPDPQFLHQPMRYDFGLPSPVI